MEFTSIFANESNNNIYQSLDNERIRPTQQAKASVSTRWTEPQFKQELPVTKYWWSKQLSAPCYYYHPRLGGHFVCKRWNQFIHRAIPETWNIQNIILDSYSIIFLLWLNRIRFIPHFGKRPFRLRSLTERTFLCTTKNCCHLIAPNRWIRAFPRRSPWWASRSAHPAWKDQC